MTTGSADETGRQARACGPSTPRRDEATKGSPAIVVAAVRLAIAILMAAVAAGMTRRSGRPWPLPEGLASGRVLLLGPLLETLAMLALAWPLIRALRRRRHDDRAATVVCTAIVGGSFVLSHGVQQGAGTLVSLPMALWLSWLAARTAQASGIAATVRGAALFALHALYNGALFVMLT